MNAAPILNTEARIIARHCAFAGFSIPLEANDTTSPARLGLFVLASVGAAVAGHGDAVPEASPVCSSFARGAGAADAFGVAAPAVCISFHGSDDNAR